MTTQDEDTAPEPAPAATAMRDPWELTLERLRERHPGATDGTLFCVHKFEFDPDLTLKDIRGEADLRGIPVSGRSAHSANVLLGRATRSTRRKKVQPEPEPEQRPASVTPRRGRRPAARVSSDTDSLETTLLSAVQQLQDEATADARRLRSAIEEAIAVLQAALTAGDD